MDRFAKIQLALAALVLGPGLAAAAGQPAAPDTQLSPEYVATAAKLIAGPQEVRTLDDYKATVTARFGAEDRGPFRAEPCGRFAICDTIAVKLPAEAVVTKVVRKVRETSGVQRFWNTNGSIGTLRCATGLGWCNWLGDPKQDKQDDALVVSAKFSNSRLGREREAAVDVYYRLPAGVPRPKDSKLAGFAAEGPIRAPAHGRTVGFVFSYFTRAAYKGDDDCPDGVALKPYEKFPEMIEQFKQLLAAKLPPSKYQQIIESSKNKTPEGLFGFAEYRGPHGEGACQAPELLPDPGMRHPVGRKSFGLNLDGTSDGKATQKTCAHQKFNDGLNGEANVDNQYYRALGCVAGYRGRDGFQPQMENNNMRDGQYSILLELTGVDSLENDEDVGVALYSSNDAMIKQAGGTSDTLGYTSFYPSDDPQFHNSLHGKIVNGVLTTEPANVHLIGSTDFIQDYYFKDARLRLMLASDGTAKGVLGGYVDWRLWSDELIKKGAIVEEAGGYMCDAVYHAFKKFADGDPDPSTGECTTISIGMDVEALPAFIIHPSFRQSASK